MKSGWEEGPQLMSPCKSDGFPDDSDSDDVTKRSGTTNCSWASCREGCTADIFKCHQIRQKLDKDLIF